MVETAHSMSVQVYGLSRYRFGDGPPHQPALVLGFGNLNEAQIRRGIRTLAQAVRA